MPRDLPKCPNRVGKRPFLVTCGGELEELTKDIIRCKKCAACWSDGKEPQP